MVALNANACRERQEIFNVLFKGVCTDLKTTNSMWECISTRATKLATQLNATASALSHFIDALQTVSDCANNVNGISRDIGAALTRYCIRQRSIENRLRKISQPLVGDFADELERKCAEWKHTLAAAERRHQRSCKRLKSMNTPQAETEKRQAFVELLHIQRAHYAGFVALLLPIIGFQLDIFDETTHLRQVHDSLDAALNFSDTHSMADALIEDVTFCSSSSQMKVNSSNDFIKPSEEQNVRDKQGYVAIDNSTKSSNHQHLYPSTSSMYIVNGQHKDDVIISNQKMTQQYHSNTYIPSRLRPPLPDAFIVSSVASVSSAQNSPVKNEHCMSSAFQQSLHGCSSNCSSSVRTVDSGECIRINSTSYCSGIEQTSSNTKISNGRAFNQRTLCNANSANGSVTTTSSSAALIADTLQQIDRLGLELDSYCTGLDNGVDDEENKCYERHLNKIEKMPPPVPPKRNDNLYQHPVRFRNDNLSFENRSNILPPPLPERRNSTISAATSTAPSIVDVRSSSAFPLTPMTMSMPTKHSSPLDVFNQVETLLPNGQASISSFNYLKQQKQ